MTTAEFEIKWQRVKDFLADGGYEGVLIGRRDNFAWFTCGGNNYVGRNSEKGVVNLLIEPNRLLLFANSVEAPRFAAEEIADLPVEIVEYPWYEDPAESIRPHIKGRKVASDTGIAGTDDLASDFARLRWQLTEAELERYRVAGRRVSQAMEAACRSLTPGMKEFEIAALLNQEMEKRGTQPFVTLVAADERIHRFRHPIPTAKELEKHAMLVCCASLAGLVVAVTRFVHFGPLPGEIREKHQAVSYVDAVFHARTRPGNTAGQVLQQAIEAYAEVGYPNEWRLHHQGGATGYAGRDYKAVPGDETVILSNQAFAWNPSITGTKAEDTIIVNERGYEVVSVCSDDWPTITVEVDGVRVQKPDILVL